MLKKRLNSHWYLALLVAAFLFLNGCAGLDTVTEMMSGVGDLFADDDNADPPATIPEEFQGEIQPDLIWKESVGHGADEKFLKLIPAVRTGKLYVAEHKGLLQARNLSDGEIIWETVTEFQFAAGPSLGGELLFIGTSHGEVVAYDIATGAQKWLANVPSEVTAVPVVTKGKVIVRTTDGKVIALNEQDGGVLWTVEHSVPALSIRGAGAPLVLDDAIIVGGANGKLVSLQLIDGKVLWEATIAIPSGRSEVERLVDLDVDPIESHGSLFVCSYQGGTTAASEGDGDVIWRNENVSSYSSISSDLRYLYISDSHGDVWQLDQRNGASLWKQKDMHNRRLTAAVNYGNYVVVGDFEGYVHWLSTNDGRVLGRIKIAKSPIETKPVIEDGLVIVYAKDGTLAAMRAK